VESRDIFVVAVSPALSWFCINPNGAGKAGDKKQICSDLFGHVLSECKEFPEW